MKQTRVLLAVLGLIVSVAVNAAQVRKVTVPSASMDKDIPAIIILPDSYSETNSFPVVYLLHGYSSSPQQTLGLLDDVLRRAADTCQMLIVLPDGGYNSWYLDSPVRTERKYETFIATELTRFLDVHYRTIPLPRGRAITGGSMGGYGAMFVGLRHKAIFGVVGSLSGGVDFRPFPENWDLKQVLGPIGEFRKRWDDHAVVNNLGGLKPGQLAIYLDVGTSDAFLDVNRALHKKLLEMNIPHVYVERPGHHDDPYWKVATRYQLAFFGDQFKEIRLTAQSP